MIETTYLRCAACDHYWPVDTPKSTEKLRAKIVKNSKCRCGSTIILREGHAIRHGNSIKRTSKAWRNNVTKPAISSKTK